MSSELELRLSPETVAPMLSRAAVAAMRSDMPDAAAYQAELLTTELVSNAVKHADLDPSQEIIVRVTVNGFVRVEVLDPGPPFRVAARASTPSPGSGGWGLFLVEAIATSWGVEPVGAGKKVWFEIGTAAHGATAKRL